MAVSGATYGRTMSAVATEEAETPELPRMTEQEYLAFEEESEGRHEFRDGEVVGVSGGTASHSMVEGNLVTSLGNRLRGGPCRRYDSGLRLSLQNRGQSFYPDASVVCGEPEFAPHEHKELTLLNPRAAFEVLSASTEAYDRGEKFDLYREIAPLQSYVLIDPAKPKVHVFERQANGLWSIDVREGLDATLPLVALGIEIPFAELYENVSFEAREDSATRP